MMAHFTIRSINKSTWDAGFASPEGLYRLALSSAQAFIARIICTGPMSASLNESTQSQTADRSTVIDCRLLTAAP